MLKIWIGNLGRYNEGELVGDWIELPKEKKELDYFLKNVVGLNDEYEEYMINDYETDLPIKVSEYDNLTELNLLAKVAEEVEDMDKIQAYLDYQGNLSRLELMNLMKQEDNIVTFNYSEHLEGCSNEEKFGYTVIENLGLSSFMEENNLSGYFDYKQYGIDRSDYNGLVLLDSYYLDMDSSEIDLKLYTLKELKEEYDLEKDKIKVIYKEVGKEPVVKKIEDTLEAKQKLVDGLIEIVPYKDNYLLICNEEGKVCNLKPNLDFGYDYIAGNCFVVGDDYENAGFKSVEDVDIETIIEDLKNREIELIDGEMEM